MKIIKFSLGQLQANCYFLIEENDCLIIDPADDAAFILEELLRRKLKLIGIFATHGHFDHVGAVGETQISLDIPLYIFREDLFLVDRLVETAEYFLGYKPHFIKPTNTRYLQHGKFQILNFKFKILHSPGHTPGSCCFYFEKERIIFTGDSLFKEGIGRYDFSYSSKDDLKKSLKELFKLPKNTIVYPGHGEETTIADEINR